MESGKTIILDVEPIDTILHIKDKIIDKEGPPCSAQYRQLMYAGKVLDNQRCLCDYNIIKGMIHFVQCFLCNFCA